MSARIIALASRRAARKPGYRPAYVDPRRFARFDVATPSRLSRLFGTRDGLIDAACASGGLIAFLAACAFFWIGTPQ